MSKSSVRLVAAAASVAVVIAVVGALIAPSSAFAFVQRTGDNITVTQSIRDDLYVFGSNIEISGDVDGDVVAFGSNITISGDVTGDVISAGQNVRVEGSVGGTVRAAGSDVTVAGKTEDDVVLAGSNVRVTREVGRDVVVAGANVSVSGDVKRNVLAGAQSLTIASAVGGNVTADVDRMTVASGAEVAGDVTYYSDREANIDGSVRGDTRRHPARVERGRDVSAAESFFLGVLSWVRGLIGMLVFTLLAVLLARRAVVRGAEVACCERTGLSIGIGFAIIALALPAAGMVFLIGLLIGGWWLSLVWLAIVWLLALLGMVSGALAAAHWVLHRRALPIVNPLLPALLGVLAIWVIGAIPFIGWLVAFVVMLAGMGGLVLAAYGRRHDVVVA